MAIEHIDITVILPATIPNRADSNELTELGWVPGRLPIWPLGADHPLEWNADDARLSSWLSPRSRRRWYRRPGGAWDEDNPDVDRSLRDLLDADWGTNMAEDRGEEITLGPRHTVALDGVDLFRLHDGPEHNALAAIRLLLFLPVSEPDADDGELAQLQEVLADFALTTATPAAAKIAEFYAAILRPGAELSRADLRPRVLTQVILEGGSYGGILNDIDIDINELLADLDTEDFPDDLGTTALPQAPDTGDVDAAEAPDDSDGTQSEPDVSDRLEHLARNVVDLREPAVLTRTAPGTVTFLKDDSVVATGPSGMAFVHHGDVDFVRYRDACLLAQVQQALCIEASNTVYEASHQGEEAITRIAAAHPILEAYERLPRNGVLSYDRHVQQVYDLASDAQMLDRLLVSTSQDVREFRERATQIQSRRLQEHDATTNALLTVLAVVSLTTPVGLAIAQFQQPWPTTALVGVGIAITVLGLVAAVVIYRYATRRRLRLNGVAAPSNAQRLQHRGARKERRRARRVERQRVRRERRLSRRTERRARRTARRVRRS